MPTRLLHPTHTTYRTHPVAWPIIAGTLLLSPYPNDTYPTGAKAETQTGFAKSWQRGASGFAAHCTSHRSTVHRATQRTAFDTRPAKHARRHIFHQETCPAAPYTRKYSRDAFAPPAHTHENASKDTYPACLYTERALPHHILPAYSPRPNHSSISCKRKNQKHTATHVPSGYRTAHKGKQMDILRNVFTKSCHKVLQKHKNVLPLHTQYGDKACQARQDTPESTLDA